MPLGSPPIAPGFMVLQGNRLEDLMALLVGHLRHQPLGPLEPEVILVQSNGMKHWVELALADDAALGICAATRLELPNAFLWQAYRSVLGAESVPEHMPLDKPALVWRLVRMLPTLIENNPVYAPLRRYLGSDTDGRKRLQLAQQLADVLDGYQSYRADWLADWSAGRDRLNALAGPGSELDPDQHWQAQLWRDIQADVTHQLGVLGSQASRAAVHDRFMQAVRLWPNRQTRPQGLPPRIVVFGISSLSMQVVEALAALGQVCQVMLFVQNPCQYHWGDVVEGRELLRQLVKQRLPARRGLELAASMDLSELHGQAHPLLAAWGKQGRDYLHLLAAFDLPETYRQRLNTIDAFWDPLQNDGADPSRLSRLQSDIFNLAPPPPVPQPVPVDDSIVLVSAHSAQREVEVLHDQLLGWFDADPSLQPRDVMVMVPDMAVFAPHIQAVFGRFEPSDQRHIPFSVADQSARQLPMARALEALLNLPQSRITLSEWLDAFEVPAVRHRFGLTEDDVSQLHGWLLNAGVRWGLHAQHRLQWGLPAGMVDVAHNTWSFGLRRMLLGYAAGDAQPWQGVVPLASVGGLSARLVGALAEWLDAMDLSLTEMRRVQTPSAWLDTLRGLMERFFAPIDDAEERQYQRLLQPLTDWLELCRTAGLEDALPLVVVREHWQAQWDAPGLHQRFFGGGVQFATLMPMRSIPFRAVCLLGMNDADYPRRVLARDFDLMRRNWRPGDRSRREDDRYLFLEALLSARERLYISWQGRRASDDAEQPPSVLVAQLMDCFQAYWQAPPSPLQQPLQPFSRRYFFPANTDEPVLRTYAEDWQRVHHPAQGPAQAVAVALDSTPERSLPDALSLSALTLFLREPVEWYYRERLGVRLETVDDAEDDSEPFVLDGLQQYQQTQILLQADDPEQALHSLQLAGQFPLAGFGQSVAARLLKQVETVRERWPYWSGLYPDTVPPLSLDGPPGLSRIDGVVAGLLAGQRGLLQHEWRPGAISHRVGSQTVARCDVLRNLWARHLVLSACGHRVTSVALGLDGCAWLPPLAPDEALPHWQDLLLVVRAAWQAPLPVSGKAAIAFEQTRLLADGVPPESRPAYLDPVTAARKVFDGDAMRAGEHRRSPYLARAFDNFSPLVEGLPAWSGPLYGALVRQVRLGLPEEGVDS